MFSNASPLVGGQAVMEGVMMRRGNVYALAVRQADGTIVVERRPWISLTGLRILRLPLLRGFPILLETLVNGIKALNRSAWYCSKDEDEEIKGWHLILTMMLALGMAVGLFVVLPHALSLLMLWLGLGADVEGFSFHMWDGLFKFAIFIGYIVAISFVPDIRRVFRYHGAEHKVLRAFESGDEVSATRAKVYSRLHPRCGTTFLLIVLSLAIVVHTVLVPPMLGLWEPDGFWPKHVFTVLAKLLLMIPISALAYELIHASARATGFFGSILRAPGMGLQCLTTWEPSREQLEVAVAALDGVLGHEAPERIHAPEYIADTSACPVPDGPPDNAFSDGGFSTGPGSDSAMTAGPLPDAPEVADASLQSPPPRD